MARRLKITRSGYYALRTRPASQRDERTAGEFAHLLRPDGCAQHLFDLAETATQGDSVSWLS